MLILIVAQLDKFFARSSLSLTLSVVVSAEGTFDKNETVIIMICSTNSKTKAVTILSAAAATRRIEAIRVMFN